jgi:asparagine synthase (glutamine-hydrolysing)
MCGIVGIAALGDARPPHSQQVQRMCSVLEHRGPDDQGVDILDGVALGNRRLAVIDIAGGRQPLGNESRTIRTVQNGEIYNFQELRRSLEKSSHRFRTNCDTEVIVHAYEQFGLDFVHHLNGMFAIALHDRKKQKLILARDHLGIKPLYYSWIDKQYLIWGSEVKALLASGLLSPQLDIDSLGQFLSWEYVPGEHTLMKNVYELQPAEMLVADLTNATSEQRFYWDIPAPSGQATGDPREWEQRIDDKIHQCVKRQLVSDVPLGAFLSGGVDSSLVVSAMDDPKVFSIGFDDASYNELDYARRVANHVGAEHVSDILRPNVASLFELLLGYLDDPIGDFSIFPTYLISKIAREHVTVALSGDGGDELFGGYETYLAQRYAYWLQYLPNPIRQKLLPALVNRLRPSPKKKGTTNKIKRFVEGLAYPAVLDHARWRIFASDILKQELFTTEAAEQLVTPTGAHIENLFARANKRPSLDRSLYVDVKSYLSDNCLVKVDRMSMAVSLEVRVPMLDKELVELAFKVPQQLKIENGKTKAILKRIAARHVPRDCVYRPKEGFSIPMKHWLGDQFLSIMEHYLEPRRISGGGLFRISTVENLKREHLAGRANHSHVLWSLVLFEAWKDRWLNSAR